ISSTTFFYDNALTWDDPPTQGLLKRVMKIHDGPSGPPSDYYFDVNRYDYDQFGNRTSETTYRNAGTPITTTTNHSACNNTQPLAITNSAGQTTSFAYDCVLGLPTTNVDPNGVSHEIRYDDFGRPWKEWAPPDSENFPTRDYTYQWPLAVVGGTANLTHVHNR